MQRRRSTLFVGALAAEGLAAALAGGADLVCLDLEDAVPPDRKDEGRAAAAAAASAARVPAEVQLVARVNAMASPEGPADLRSLARDVPGIGGFMIPKVEGADEVRAAAALLDAAGSPADVYAIIETPDGLEEALAIARAHPRLKALFFGGFDLSTALGCDMAWEPLLYARSRVVHAAAAGGLECLDSPFPDVGDIEGLRASCAQVRALGMTGRAAKHASQVSTINAAFTPGPAEIERARRIVEAFRADPTRPLVFEGKLVELPTIKRMEKLVSDTGFAA